MKSFNKISQNFIFPILLVSLSILLLIPQSAETVLANYEETFDFKSIFKPETLLFNFLKEELKTLELEKRNQLLFELKEKERIEKENLISKVYSNDISAIEELIKNACLEVGCDSNQLIRVMYCESNGKIYADNGLHKGLFQHDKNFWSERANRFGFSNYDIFDPIAQIYVSANMFALGMQNHWHCK